LNKLPDLSTTQKRDLKLKRLLTLLSALEEEGKEGSRIKLPHQDLLVQEDMFQKQAVTRLALKISLDGLFPKLGALKIVRDPWTKIRPTIQDLLSALKVTPKINQQEQLTSDLATEQRETNLEPSKT